MFSRHYLRKLIGQEAFHQETFNWLELVIPECLTSEFHDLCVFLFHFICNETRLLLTDLKTAVGPLAIRYLQKQRDQPFVPQIIAATPDEQVPDAMQALRDELQRFIATGEQWRRDTLCQNPEGPLNERVSSAYRVAQSQYDKNGMKIFMDSVHYRFHASFFQSTEQQVSEFLADVYSREKPADLNSLKCSAPSLKRFARLHELYWNPDYVDPTEAKTDGRMDKLSNGNKRGIFLLLETATIVCGNFRRRNYKALAIAMGTHARLGQISPIHTLDQEVVRLIAGFALV